MSNYSKVQFISWEIHTGPNESQSKSFYQGLYNPKSADRRLDVYGQCCDIEARVKFTADAIDKARRSMVPDPATLKVFMAPEFLFRGAGGAYLHDLINGWERGAPADFPVPDAYKGKWGGLFGELRALVAKADYEDWLFVFGTAISASFPTRSKTNPNFDLSKKGEIYNSALIQRGGTTHGAHTYVSRKHYMSDIDFINEYSSSKLHNMGNVKPFDPAGLVPRDILGVNEAGAVFRIDTINGPTGAPIDFGIEICKDHLCSGGNEAHDYGRIRTSNQFVKIQLVPSGGASLEEASIRLQAGTGSTPTAYAFNCDGMNGASYPGSHTQIWNGTAAPNHLFETTNGKAFADTRVVDVAARMDASWGSVNADQLWNSGLGLAGSGQVRIVKALPL
jgi:hypothetical protein